MVTRMATLASGGRIDLDTVNEEIARNNRSCTAPLNDDLIELLGKDYEDRFDLFDVVQLKYVIKICRASSSLSEAGKKLFAVSRTGKRSNNDSDRLSKYLARFGLNFHCLQ